jgi:hypothetical protein
MQIMGRMTTSVTPIVVWNVLRDVTNWPKWTPTVNKIDALDSKELRIGSRYRVHQPKLAPTVYAVTALKPGEVFTWAAKTLGATLTADHRISFVDGTTTVEFSFAVEGLLARPIGWRYRGLISKYVATEARSLKARCEAD